ncbi:MAG: hypothetical protein GY756_05230 [bacterium]|nr:hypothetical protein [bacterium]
MMIKRILIAVILLTTVTVVLDSNAGENDSKAKLISSIKFKQEKLEDKIVEMWMNGDRGKEFNRELSNYLTLEVRRRAFANNNYDKSMLHSVSTTYIKAPKNPIDLGKKIVLEYFKRRGINLTDKKFIKGTYYIQSNNDKNI